MKNPQLKVLASFIENRNADAPLAPFLSPKSRRERQWQKERQRFASQGAGAGMNETTSLND